MSPVCVANTQQSAKWAEEIKIPLRSKSIFLQVTKKMSKRKYFVDRCSVQISVAWRRTGCEKLSHAHPSLVVNFKLLREKEENGRPGVIKNNYTHVMRKKDVR